MENISYLLFIFISISTINDATFKGFPNLEQLQLSGNRFTTPFRLRFFEINYYLREIRLGDNPWRCECSDPNFFEFFEFINKDPMRVSVKKHI